MEAVLQTSPRLSTRIPAFIVTAGACACAIPVQHVVETMRPLPIERIPGAPAFVRGVSVIRGMPVPVVDLNTLLSPGASSSASCGRFVIIRVGVRRIALAVERVVGLKELDETQIGEMPPLLHDLGADLVEAIGTDDAQLLIVLRASRIIPEEIWATLALGPDAR
jgi:purine-binding chemotaxis protein CheW